MKNERLNYRITSMWRILFCRSVFICLALAQMSAVGHAQSSGGTIKGQVTDPSGAAVPAVTVVLLHAHFAAQQVQTNEEGRYVFRHLAAGTYTLQIQAKGFAGFQKAGMEIKGEGTQTIDVHLVVAMEKQHVTVEAETEHPTVTIENNASALILKGKDLEALSDDPDELESQLQALAGPAAGPSGGELYIDGFTGGQLPPKSAIREIRVNQNPFSAQYDKLGYGRIEVFTKPGQDKWHGQIFSMFNNSALNSRNPFAAEQPAYHREFINAHLGGPLGKKASLSMDFGHRNMSSDSVVSAVILDSNLQQSPFSQAISSPKTNDNFSGRLDYQLSSNNTLTARYQLWRDNDKNSGIGQFSLASQGYNAHQTEQSIQISDSQVVNSHVVTDFRLELLRDTQNQIPVSRDSTLQVVGAFTGGGSSQGQSANAQDHIEFQNLTSISKGKHYLTLGGRLRDLNIRDNSRANFNGTFTFSSIAGYQAAESQLVACNSAGGSNCQAVGASQFSITGGQPLSTLNWLDLGLYFEDQWRIRSNMSLNAGLRYETQNSIHDHSDFAPRLGLAWAPGNGKNKRTVLRAGFGIFYDRFEAAQVLQDERLNGVTQTQYIVANPDFFPTIPTPAGLAEMGGTQTASAIYQPDPHLRAPYTMQAAAGVERQVTRNATVSVTYLNSHGVHQLMTRNINAPLPGTYGYCSAGDSTCTPSAGIRPDTNEGNLYQYESSGLFNQNQIITNLNLHMGSRLSVFGFYILNFAHSDTSGVSSFPMDSYDMKLDYARAAFDVRHRLFLGGSLSLPKGVRLSPFMMANSGTPFNITVGEDLNGDSIYNDRPAIAPAGATGSNIVKTRWGTFDTNPKSGETIIPINYGTGPGQFSLNLRLSKTFGFGRKAESATAEGGMPGPPPGGGRGGPPPGGGGGGGLGPGGLSSSGGRPPGLGGPGVSYRYSLTLGVGALNAFNIVNLGPPVGQLSSPLFGKSNSLATGFGPPGGGNRSIDFQVAFGF